MTPEPWPTLVTRWRDMADTVAQFGADAAAAALRLAAGELEVAHRAHQGEPLPLAQAAAESGLSAGHLGRMVRQGTLPNAGAPGRPRIARAHLPRRGPAPPRDVLALIGGRPSCCSTAK